MIMRTHFVVLLLLAMISSVVQAQCPSSINTFPYQEDFELNNGNWVPGGTGSDWAWGTPAKPVIQAAGSGSKCWTTGTLTGSSYTDGEASWLQSPCFDFSSLQFPMISLKVFWETEQKFDGASLQASVDNGVTWTTIGNSASSTSCLNKNWYNTSSINYLSPLGGGPGWSGNSKPSSGSCGGGNGSLRWVVASQAMPMLAGKPAVLLRFAFGAGTICNAYDGFAIDSIVIREADPIVADFGYSCSSTPAVVNFADNSTPCPDVLTWDFGDPGSGASNTATGNQPTHTFSSPGTYTVTLSASGYGAPATVSKSVTILGATATLVTPADCETNSGGVVQASASGATGISYTWNTNPAQLSPTASNLPSGTYIVTASAPAACTAKASVTVPLDTNCPGIYFPSAFTPNGDGRNDNFGPIGGIGAITSYKLSVYNRWGELVFQSTNPFQKWDGLFKGKRQNSGIFVWYAEFTTVASAPVDKRKGIVTLIQ